MMIYLKTFESIIKPLGMDETKRIYSPLINWEMILDLKEMSLEYLDKGARLDMSIVVKDTIIYELWFNHDGSKIEWFDRLYKNEYDEWVGNKEDIKYYINLWYQGNDGTEDCFELIYRIRGMYPDENFK